MISNSVKSANEWSRCCSPWSAGKEGQVALNNEEARRPRKRLEEFTDFERDLEGCLRVKQDLKG